MDWVAPWSVAARQEDPLSGVLVHAHADELADEQVTITRAAERLAARGAAALLVDGHQAVAADAVAAVPAPAGHDGRRGAVRRRSTGWSPT